jgi:lipoyl(octanoyl) transferase
MSSEALKVLAKPEAALQAYLLEAVDFEAAHSLQRHLVKQVAAEPENPSVVLCEHPPVITIGRQGSRAHIRCEPEELLVRHWAVRWVNRGGGCLLHAPGQLAIYSILPLDHIGLGLPAYLDKLQTVLAKVLDDFSIACDKRDGQAGLWVGNRMIAALGVAVRDWVSYFGAYLNVNPDLELFRLVRQGSADAAPMTSLERERRGRLRPSLVRERFLEHFANQFSFTRTSLFFHHAHLDK